MCTFVCEGVFYFCFERFCEQGYPSTASAVAALELDVTCCAFFVFLRLLKIITAGEFRLRYFLAGVVQRLTLSCQVPSVSRLASLHFTDVSFFLLFERYASHAGDLSASWYLLVSSLECEAL